MHRVIIQTDNVSDNMEHNLIEQTAQQIPEKRVYRIGTMLRRISGLNIWKNRTVSNARDYW